MQAVWLPLRSPIYIPNGNPGRSRVVCASHGLGTSSICSKQIAQVEVGTENAGERAGETSGVVCDSFEARGAEQEAGCELIGAVTDDEVEDDCVQSSQ